MPLKSQPRKQPQTQEFSPDWAISYGLEDTDNLPQNIPSVEGKLVKLYDAKPTKKGNSTYQGGILKTEHGEIKFTIFGTEIPKNWWNKDVRLSSVKGREGLEGVEYSHNEYKGEISEQLSISQKAEVELAEDAPHFSPAPRNETPTVAPQRQERPAAQTNQTHVEGGRELLESELLKILTVQKLCDSLIREEDKYAEYPEETKVSYVVNAMITAERMGCLRIPLDPPKPKVVYDPPNWAETIIPHGSKEGKTLGEVGKPFILQLEAYRKEKGLTKDFWACVAQAAVDLSYDQSEPEDYIP